MSILPRVMTMPFGELDYEQIAALRPDIIIATHSGITEEEYGRLTQIAPTLAQSGDYPDFGMPWQEQTRSIGEALGRPSQAEEVVAGVEAKIAEAGSRHAGFQGATVAWVSPAGEGQYWAVGPTTPPMRFLSALGLNIPPALAQVIGDKDSAQISSEQLALLDADALIFQGRTEEGVAAFRNNPLVPAIRGGQSKPHGVFLQHRRPGLRRVELQHRSQPVLRGGRTGPDAGGCRGRQRNGKRG